MTRIASLAALAVVLAAPFPAFAASSQWAETEGGGVRLIVESHARPDGSLRGAIEIDLRPGWKTYWRDPGDAGIPPTIDARGTAGLEGAEILFPAPKRFDDGASVWAGYGGPVSLPVTFSLSEGADIPDAIDAHVFLGVCEDICIPVDAHFAVDLSAGGAAEDAAVEAAFAALPLSATKETGISSATLKGDAVTVKAESSENAQLFVVAPAGWSFAAPKPDGTAGFAFDILHQPKDQTLAGSDIAYTLVSNGKAVDGTFRLP